MLNFLSKFGLKPYKTDTRFIRPRPLQNRVPGNKRDRCRWQMKGAFVGAAVGKIKEKRKPADFSGLPQEGIVCLLPLPKIKALKFRSTARFQGSFLFDKTLNFLTGAVCTPFFNAQIGLQIVQLFR